MATFHLTDTDHPDGISYAIKQGATFNKVAFYFDDDLTGWFARGQVRDNYVDNGGVIKATFSFEPLNFIPRSVNGVTKTCVEVKPILTAAETQSLIFDLRPRSDDSVIATPGKNVWVYDIELVSPSAVVYREVEGWVEVSKEATR